MDGKYLVASVFRGSERNLLLSLLIFYKVVRDLTPLDWGKVERRGTYMTRSNCSFILLCCIFRVKITWWNIKFTVLTTANYKKLTVFCSAQLFHQLYSAQQLNALRFQRLNSSLVHILKVQLRVFFCYSLESITTQLFLNSDRSRKRLLKAGGRKSQKKTKRKSRKQLESQLVLRSWVDAAVLAV